MNTIIVWLVSNLHDSVEHNYGEDDLKGEHNTINDITHLNTEVKYYI